MATVNIPIKSSVNTTDDGLFTPEPSFDAKNALVYRGIAENMTYEEGDGILSTTGKSIKVNRNVLEAGSQSFSLPLENYYTVENMGSKSIGENEVCINGIVAGANASYFYYGDKRVPWGLDDYQQTLCSTIHNTDSFVFVAKTGSVAEIWIDDRRIFEGVLPSGIDFGSTLTASRIKINRINKEIFLIGFDDEDYRKRALLVVDATNLNNIKLLRGFGLVSNKGWVTGEPIPMVKEDTTSIPVTLSGSNDWITLPNAGPNVTSNSNYKVLDNGSISFWTGAFDPNAKSQTINSNKTFLQLIADENAALGASITAADGTQTKSGETDWHWKIHYTNGVKNRITPNGQEHNEKYINANGIELNAPPNATYYLYGRSKLIDDVGAETFERMRWIWGINFGDESGIKVLEYKLDTAELIDSSNTSTTTQHDCFADCKRSLKHVHILGDWTYGYDSMKAYKDLTDYDCVFPYLRLFFNVVGNRGKYFDYGPGWIKFYHYDFGWLVTAKEVVACHAPLTIVTHTEGREKMIAFNKSIGSGEESFDVRTQDYLKISAERNAANLGIAENVIEPVGCVRFTDWDVKAISTPWRAYQDRFTAYKSYFSKDGDKDVISTSEWVTCPSDAELPKVFALRKIEIIGEGKGLKEEVFNFGGLGDDTLLNSFNTTLNITPDKKQYSNTPEDYPYFTEGNANSDLLRLGLYGNLNTTLSYKNTLLFNAADLDVKFHIAKKDDDYNITIYSDKKAQWLTLKYNGEIKVDKLTDYLFRVNIVGEENVLSESRDGIFSLVKGFNSYIGENVMYVADLQIRCPSGDTSSNNTLQYADGINTNLLDESKISSFLMPEKTISSYISTIDMDYFETTVLKNRHGFIKNRLRNSNILDGVEVYYTSLTASADNSYKCTDKLPDGWGDFVSLTGVQSYESDKDGFTWWIDASTVIYPVAIGSKVSGINYQTSTIDLPGNYAVRFYTQNNKTWPVYNQNAQVYFGNNIFTIMGSNYYFDGQGVYYLGDTQSGGALGQYSENILIAYAIGMKYLCNAPSEAYFYSPFDRCLYIFTSSNTMQKSTSLSRFGDILDSCYCPVNQSLYILFDGKLLIKTQDDMALIDVEGNALQTTADGVQVVNNGNHHIIHSPYLYEEILPLHFETEWLGTPDALSKYNYCDIVLFGSGEVTLALDLQTIAGINVSSNVKHLHIRESDWQNNHYRIRLTAKEPVGNAFKVVVKSDDKVGVWNLTMYMENVSTRSAAKGWA